MVNTEYPADGAGSEVIDALVELLAQSRVMYESLDFDDTGGRVGRAIDRAASVLDRCVNLGLFEPFDPAKVKIEFHRYTMNQGTFTIFYDNEKILVVHDDINLVKESVNCVLRPAWSKEHPDGNIAGWQGISKEEAMDLAKGIYERGLRTMRPLCWSRPKAAPEAKGLKPGA